MHHTLLFGLGKEEAAASNNLLENSFLFFM
jgi:hypothetical protein